MSAGVATYPQHGVERSELVRVADSALYMAKEQGKNTVRVYRPDVIELAELRRLAEGRPRRPPARGRQPRPRRRRARRLHRQPLLHGRRARRPRGQAHGPRLRVDRADPARRQPARPRQAGHSGGDPPQARPAERGRAPRARAPSADRLPDARLLGVEPVATWVLHHHERWDGHGYPSRRPATTSRSARASSSSRTPTTR